MATIVIVVRENREVGRLIEASDRFEKLFRPIGPDLGEYIMEGLVNTFPNRRLDGAGVAAMRERKGGL